ncbi:ECF transporter S component [Dysgonomonas sp. 511]|uniref:ECF transporter S component n=1 Tax=Dysgonomonas sp. 511 TaxID=2302930 RepID=UPI0013D554B8|nr:ECF transporter S component [Dysgonomonas sp. 511]NDV77791.1 ECF transporter S component [Dysgonomonas sp. 511]
MKTAIATKLYSLNYKETKTYILTILFIACNVLFPYLCHLIPSGGQMWLPVYFFTLIAAYKYGLNVGLLTAITSPLINNIFLGMPPNSELLSILIRSMFLAGTAACVAHHHKKISIQALTAIVVFYQVAGRFAEWLLIKDFYSVTQDFVIGIPGLLVQIIGGYFLLRLIAKL